MDGLAWALDIVKIGGEEALEKEIRMRGAYFLPLELSPKKISEAERTIAARIMATLMPTVMFTLHDQLGFGRKRLLRWKDTFLERVAMMSKCDPLGTPYEQPRDYAEYLKDKYKIGFDWDKIETVAESSEKARPKMCRLDYAVQFLEEHGQAEAAKLLREYGGMK